MNSAQKTSLKILYSCPLDPVKHAAPGQHVTSVVRELAALGHDLTLIHQGDALTNLEPSLQHPLKLKRYRFVGRLVTDIGYSIALFKMLRNNEYDRVYHRLEKWSVLPMMLFKVFKIPVVLEVNADIRAELVSVGANVALRKVYPVSEGAQVRLASKIVAVSEGIGKNLVKHFPKYSKKVVVIENGADTEVYSPRDQKQACETLGLNPNYKYIVFSGSFQPWQGLDTLVFSAAEVIRRFPDVRFMLIGDGRQGATLERLIKEEGIESHFTMTGWLDSEMVAQYLAASDICVAPYSESAALNPTEAVLNYSGALMKCSPLKIYTYMAMGKPVVAGGFLDGGQRLVDWGVGMAFTPGSAAELSEALAALLSDKTLRDLSLIHI